MFHWLLLEFFFSPPFGSKHKHFSIILMLENAVFAGNTFLITDFKVKSVHLPKPSHYSCLLPRLTALVTPQMRVVFATKRRSNQPPGEKLRSRATD